jgi:hypothetical protein
MRTNPVGGDVSGAVAVAQVNGISIAPGAPAPTMTIVPPTMLGNDAAGKNVLLATHGFKVDQADGIVCLGNWETLLQLDKSFMFVGVLWPGDSAWLGALCYPGEGRHAIKAGNLLASFVDIYLAKAASISFVSHSLGARMVLQAVLKMGTPPRQVALMAGAINDDCLVHEYKNATAKVPKISVLASMKDDVLAKAFPIGNILEGIIDVGHPYWDAALGHSGPSKAIPGKLLGPWQIPDSWMYGHHHYLELDPPPAPPFTLPLDIPDIPPQGSPPPRPVTGWQPAWSAAFVSDRFE